MGEASNWTIENGTELLLSGVDGDTRRVCAADIWKARSELSGGELPPLSGLGLRFSRKCARLSLALVSCEGIASPFGQLALRARDARGGSVFLSAAHKSNHVIIAGVWHPLQDDEYQQIAESVAKASLLLDEPLSFQEYVEVLRLFRNADWFESDVLPTAESISREVSVDSTVAGDCPLFTGHLYDYQQKGSNWLAFMAKQSHGMVLGDSMGLGKTIQIINLVCATLQESPGARVLIVCPSALMENWVREFGKFSSGISIEKHAGPSRTGDYRNLTASVVVTTYDVARIDTAVLQQITWDLVVLDEAQWIKNPRSQRAVQIKQLPRKVSVAVTGTPFENHMTDLWSLLDFCLPGALGTLASFNCEYGDDDESAERLGELISPLLLRRHLSDIPNDLPDLVPIPMPIRLELHEAQVYEERRRQYLKTGATLATISKLVSDLSVPSTFKNGISSLKYDYLDNVSEEVFSNDSKLLVFADKLAAVEEIKRINQSRVPTFTLTGADSMDARQRIVDDFSAVGGAAMMIANPDVGGVGLNITEANHVFHFSPQWNPAKIDQADARAHRHGQKKTVFAHYPYYANTIEEYMWEKVYQKRGLSEQVTAGNKGEIGINEIAAALRMSPVQKGEV